MQALRAELRSVEARAEDASLHWSQWKKDAQRREAVLEQQNATLSTSLASTQRKLDDATAALPGAFGSNGMSAAAQLADQQLADTLEELNGTFRSTPKQLQTE